MKAAVVTNGGEGGRLAKELCDALGLKHVRNLIIQMPRNGLFTVTAEFYPEIDGVKQMTTILKKFRLEEIPGETAVKAQCRDCGKELEPNGHGAIKGYGAYVRYDLINRLLVYVCDDCHVKAMAEEGSKNQ